MELSSLIRTLVAIRDSAGLENVTVFVQGHGAEAFELEEIQVTFFNNLNDEEALLPHVVLSDGINPKIGKGA